MPRFILVASWEQVALLQSACASNHQTFALLYLELYNWVVEYKLLLKFTGSKYLQSDLFPGIKSKVERQVESVYNGGGSDKYCLQP